MSVLKVLFITALDKIRVSGVLGRGVRLPFDLILTNDSDQIKNLLSEPFEAAAGQIETLALKNANAAIYSITEQAQSSLPKDDAIRFLNLQLGRVQIFLGALWLLKDNAVNFDLGFAEYPYRGARRSITSNFRAIRFSKADGTFDPVVFTESDVRNAREIYSKLFSKEIVDRDEYTGWIVPEDFERLSRIFYFVQGGARGSSDLGNKIARYATCFEALFCTDSSEMAHKLAERIAFFLGNDGSERINIFKKIKVAYSVRSKVVHGDKLSKKVGDQASDLVRTCDDLLRKSLIKILTTNGLRQIFSRPSHELEEFLTCMVLDNHNPALS